MISWIKHIVVYTLENRSFDQLLGHFPGADGLSPRLSVPAADGWAARPFPIKRCSLAQLANPNHSWEAIHREWNHGAMDGFVREDGRDVMGYYPPDHIAAFMEMAHQARVLDHYFCSVLGPTFPNRLYQIAGTSGGLKNDPPVCSLRGFEMPTVFDQLEAAEIGWRAYVGDMFPAPGGRALARAAQFCPLLWFPRFVTPPLSWRLSSFNRFFVDVFKGHLPAVSWLFPGLWQSGHPPLPLDAALASALRVFRALKRSMGWKHTVFIINFDEAGGFYDHVAPPQRDSFGPGIRVPCLVLSGRLEPAVVHAVFDHTSALRLIEERFSLALLGERTQVMQSLSTALE